MSSRGARAAAIGAGMAAMLVALAGCREDKHRDDMVRRIERLEDALQRLTAEAAAARSQLDDLRARDARMSLPMDAGAAGAPGADDSAGGPLPPAATTPTPAGNAAAEPSATPLSIVSKPSGARVYVDGSVVGTTPLIFTRPAGAPPASIRVRKRGYRDRVMTLPAGKTTVEVSLIPR